ncbi:MAG: hypothetical protein Q7T81_03870 [Pseudolabrys sp.]|nr:hypothetical protein [Pseudolabrys sp.]
MTVIIGIVVLTGLSWLVFGARTARAVFGAILIGAALVALYLAYAIVTGTLK